MKTMDWKVIFLHISLTWMILVQSPPSVDFSRVFFVINSQPDPFNSKIASETKEKLLKNLEDYGVSEPKIILTHENKELMWHGAWTFVPIIKNLVEEHLDMLDYLVVLEQNSVVNLDKLEEVLNEINPHDLVFKSHALIDQENVIIHHFVTPRLRFPHEQSGFLISKGLLENILDQIGKLMKRASQDSFSIDAYHELSKLIHELNAEHGSLKHDKRFCIDQKDNANCAIHPRNTDCQATDDEVLELAKKTLFAVKTCEKFHKNRLPTIRGTWAPAALNVKYFSETEDSKFETIVLPGVKNTERGHCYKSQAIIEYFNKNAELENWEWLVIADDDTILSPRRVIEMLKCYDSNDLIQIGQRYGYRVITGQYGYDYPSGGGGMIFSRALTKRMLEDSNICKCRMDDQPDDMHFGACLTSLGIPLVHSIRMHQGRVEDYHPSLITSQNPVSFHKFWETDPENTYKKYFRNSDQILVDYKKTLQHSTIHEEL